MLYKSYCNWPPPKATVIRDGTEIELPTEQIVVGDIALVKPGDKIAVDGALSCRANRAWTSR